MLLENGLNSQTPELHLKIVQTIVQGFVRPQQGDLFRQLAQNIPKAHDCLTHRGITQTGTNFRNSFPHFFCLASGRDDGRS